jgi:hypothetical protein
MDALPKLSLEKVPIQEGQKQLKILFFAVMRCGGHKEVMASWAMGT